jgi:hypothetical protein
MDQTLTNIDALHCAVLLRGVSNVELLVRGGEHELLP